MLVGLGVSAGTDPLDRYATVLRESGRFAEVTAARITSGPSPRKVLDGIVTPTIYVLPFFMSNGYCSRVLLPRVLGLDTAASTPSTKHGNRSVHCLPPVGTASGMGRLIAWRLLDLCQVHALTPAETEVILVAHGLEGSTDAREAEAHAATLAADFARVSAAYLEGSPLIAEALARRGPGTAVVLGLFVASGRHGGIDVPGAIDRARDRGGGRIVWGGNIGEHPAMGRLLLDCVASDWLAYHDGVTEGPSPST